MKTTIGMKLKVFFVENEFVLEDKLKIGNIDVKSIINVHYFYSAIESGWEYNVLIEYVGIVSLFLTKNMYLFFQIFGNFLIDRDFISDILIYVMRRQFVV